MHICMYILHIHTHIHIHIYNIYNRGNNLQFQRELLDNYLEKNLFTHIYIEQIYTYMYINIQRSLITTCAISYDFYFSTEKCVLLSYCRE